MIRQCLCHCQRTCRFERSRKIDAICNAPPPSVKRRCLVARRPLQEMQFDVILVSQDNIRKRHRDMTGGQEFFFEGGESYQCAGVDETTLEETELLVEAF